MKSTLVMAGVSLLASASLVLAAPASGADRTVKVPDGKGQGTYHDAKDRFTVCGGRADHHGVVLFWKIPAQHKRGTVREDRSPGRCNSKDREFREGKRLKLRVCDYSGDIIYSCSRWLKTRT